MCQQNSIDTSPPTICLNVQPQASTSELPATASESHLGKAAPLHKERAAFSSSSTAPSWALCSTHARYKSHTCQFTWHASVEEHAAAVCRGGRQKAPVWVPGNCRHAAAVALPDQPGGPAVVPLQQSVSHHQQTLLPCRSPTDGSAGMCCAWPGCHQGACCC